MGGESNALTASTTSDKVQRNQKKLKRKSGDPVKLCVRTSPETFSLNLRSPFHHDWHAAGLRWLRAGVRAPLLTLLLSFNGNKWVSAMRMQRDCMKICGWLVICNWLVSWSSFPRQHRWTSQLVIVVLITKLLITHQTPHFVFISFCVNAERI